MFKKLRRRMILLNIGVVALVMITVIFLISYSSVRILRRQAEGMKARIEDSGLFFGVRNENFGDIPILGNKLIMVPIDENGNLADIAEFQRAQDEGLRKTLYGLIDDEFPDMRYIKSEERVFFTFNVEIDDLNVYFFIDATQERELNEQMIENTIFIGIAAMVLIILASMFLTKKALVPVTQAWEKQKQFVSDASHELRTPVAVIQTNMEVIGSDLDATVGSQINWIENINYEISRMTKLIDNLLFLSRKDKSAAIDEMQVSDIKETMDKLSMGLGSLAAESGLGFRIETKTALVHVPEVELERLIVILAENAIKYTDKGEVVVRTYTDSGFGVLEVSDTGHGIAAEECKKIFERFYRSEADRSRKTGGYGLGLSIARSIVESYNGKIGIDSHVGVGSKFTVRLPGAKTKKRIEYGEQ